MNLRHTDPAVGTKLQGHIAGRTEIWTLTGRTENGNLIMDRGGETDMVFNPMTFGLAI